MNTMRIRGWALIAYVLFAMLLFVVYVLFEGFGGFEFSTVGSLIGIMGSALFLIGLSAIQSALPPTKPWKEIGLILASIPAIILLSFNIQFLAPGHYRISSFLSIPTVIIQHLSPAILFIGYGGYFLIAWLTIKSKIFPAWAGWVLVISGLFYIARNFIGLIIVDEFGTMYRNLHLLMFFFGVLTESIAFTGYGWRLIKW